MKEKWKENNATREKIARQISTGRYMLYNPLGRYSPKRMVIWHQIHGTGKNASADYTVQQQLAENAISHSRASRLIGRRPRRTEGTVFRNAKKRVFKQQAFLAHSDFLFHPLPRSIAAKWNSVSNLSIDFYEDLNPFSNSVFSAVF